MFLFLGTIPYLVHGITSCKNIEQKTKTTRFDTMLSIFHSLNSKIVTPFVDYTTTIYKMASAGGDSWTATEDCFVCGRTASEGGSTSAIIYIDGETVVITQSSIIVPFGFYLKKGQTVSTRLADDKSFTYVLNMHPLLI